MVLQNSYGGLTDLEHQPYQTLEPWLFFSAMTYCVVFSRVSSTNHKLMT